MIRNNYLKIDINIRNYYGSNNTAMVFARLMYWFDKKPDGFYKFKQACSKHPLYNKGDSWGEELGMTRKVLDPIINRLVTPYLTKSAYLKSEDKFAGKMFCSYTNHKTNQTFYFMNKEAVDKFLSMVSPKKMVSDAPKPAKIMPSILPCDVPLDPPLAHTHPDLPCIQTITSLTGNAPEDVLNSKREQDKLISQEMVNTWNSHMADQVIWYPSYAKTLCNVLKEFFRGCLKTFKRYCLTIASADFLTGKARNSRFKAFLFWAIKPETIQKILLGAYGVKNFFSFSDPEEKNLEAETRRLTNQIAFVDKHISVFEDNAKREQLKLVDELKQSLDPEEILICKDESDRLFYEKYLYDPSDKSRDIAMLRRIFFEGPDGFLNRRLKERLGISDIIVIPQDLLDKKTTLESELYKKSIQLNELRLEKRGLTGLVLSPKKHLCSMR